MKTRHWVIYLCVWIAYFSVLFLTSCKTKAVTQEHFITDTTVSRAMDKSWQERFISVFEQMARNRNQEHETNIRETTHTKDSTSTMVDQNGKPIKTESWHSVVTNKDTKEVLRLQDSISVMNKQVDKFNLLVIEKDSLIRLKQDSIHVLNRELTKAEQRYITLGKYAVGAIIVLVLVVSVLIIWLIHRKKFVIEHGDNND